jgi:hypothetical protein
MPFTVLLSAASALATVSAMFSISMAAGIRLTSWGIERFELGNRLACRARFRTKGKNSPFVQGFLGYFVEACAQDDIELRHFGRVVLTFAQSNMPDITRLGVEKKQVPGVGQVWFDT